MTRYLSEGAVPRVPLSGPELHAEYEEIRTANGLAPGITLRELMHHAWCQGAQVATLTPDPAGRVAAVRANAIQTGVA